MADQINKRRLAAILAADVAGYTRLVEQDTDGTIAAWKAARDDVIKPSVDGKSGRIIKFTGDGFLVEFPSVQDAVACAIALQEELSSNPLKFRMGINVGDITDDGGDVHGEGVNIAARLEALAEPGGICISGDVYNQVRNRIDAKFEDLGEQTVKHVSAPVRIFRVQASSGAADDVSPLPELKSSIFKHPAIAVLPFDNMSGDQEQEYFADGLTEDIITALSLCRSFPVIARNSTFAYKGQSPDIRVVASELGARYVLEGSVRRSGDRVRITAQLIDADDGRHVWAEKYDRMLKDIFDLQDEITNRIATTISPELEKAEQKRSAAKAPTDLNAWDYYHRGLSLIYASTKESTAKSRDMFERALELDPDYSLAYSGISFSHARDLLLEFSDTRDQSVQATLQTARRAVECDDTDAFAHLMLAIANMWPGNFDMAIAEAERAVDLNPNSAFALMILGTALDNAGRSSEGVPQIEKSLHLNPRDPQAHIAINTLARSQLNARNYEEAVDCARKAISVRSNFPHAYYLLASALGHLDRLDEARNALSDCERIQSGFVEKRAQWQPYIDPMDNNHIHEGVRKAGLPEN